MQQDSLLDDEKIESSKGPVECLGQTFANEEARREHFTKLLREKLKDPEFRKIEGFPLGTDEAILELSDPPYYTACPNPWLNDFVEYWEAQKESIDKDYHREPFAADVSEGKTDSIYTAHSYHTKVPHKAIMRYILHYTKPGDIVFDGFCGTGMTGVAAQLCGNKNIVESLGYKVNQEGDVFEKNEQMEWKLFSKLGARKAVLNDLSPTASYISSSYNSPTDVLELEKEALSIYEEVLLECGWMYETLHTDGITKAKINYTVWSDVFICSGCTSEIVFWNSAVDSDKGKVQDTFKCSSCNLDVNKKSLEKSWFTVFDPALNETIKRAKQVPVLIKYSIEGVKGSFTKTPDESDYELIQKIEESEIPYLIPASKLPIGGNTRQPYVSHGVSHVHHFYTKRNLWVLAAIDSRIKRSKSRFILTGIVNRSTQMNRIHLKKFFFGGGGWNAGYLKGTLYISSLPIETSIFEQWKDRLSAIKKALFSISGKYEQVISNQSTTSLSLKNNTLDYLFIDPPFGANINYSELSSIWEGWLRVATNNKLEAIENSAQGKSIDDYRNLMTTCFSEAYRLLKPGRWLTVEFSNTKALIWNSIQTAIMEAGFIISNVSALDKKQGSFKAVTTSTAVKQDLVISAYKPDSKFEHRFIKESSSPDGVWDFIRTHLNYLTVVKLIGNEISTIPERNPRILYDQVITYFIRKNISVPISSKEFQIGLAQKFVERDGMIFLPEQVSEYDKKRSLSTKVKQMSIFVDDEASAIEWLRQELRVKPKNYSDIHPLFLNELSGWKKNELQLELMTLLEQNFIKYVGNDDVPNQIHTYLSTNFKDMRGLAKDDPALVAKAKDRWYVPDPSKASDIEKLRLRALLREFDVYKEEKKKIKQPRAEALRAGFNACWENQELQTILDISAKIPPAVLQEDEKLLMFYDNALTLTSNDDDDWD